MSKGIVRLLLICAAIALALPADAKVLKIGHSTWVGYGPFYIARDKGFFKDEGVEVESVIMEDTTLKMGALLAGQIDLAASTSDEFPIYMKPGKPVRYILAVDYSNGGDGIVATKDIKTLADLKGKKVAFEHGSISQYFLNILLKRNGMSQADIQDVNMTAADSGTAFVAGQVDAAVTWEPALSMGASSKNGHVLVSSTEVPGVIIDVVAVTPETIAAHGPELKAFSRAWYKALDFLAKNPDEGYAIMAKGIGGWLEKPEDFKAAAGGIKYLDKAANAELFGTPAAPGTMFKTVTDAIAVWKAFDKVQVDVTPKELIDPSFFGG